MIHLTIFSICEVQCNIDAINKGIVNNMLALYYVVTSTPDMQLNPCIDSILFIVFIEKLVRVRLRFQAHSFSGTNVPKF